jgi:hypothetical protein
MANIQHDMIPTMPTIVKNSAVSFERDCFP